MSPVETRQVGYVTEYQGSDGNWYRLNPPRKKAQREGESVDAARTRKNNELLAAGRHPATRLPLLNADPPRCCGECSHLRVKDWRTSTKGTRRWYGCELHRLGLSSSAASDIRLSWPACTSFVVAPSTPTGDAP